MALLPSSSVEKIENPESNSQKFDDGFHPSGINSFAVSHGWYVDSIEVVYNDGAKFTHGGRQSVDGVAHGTNSVFVVPVGEYVTAVRMRCCGWVDQLQFVTNKGTQSPVFGCMGGSLHTLDGEGLMLIGIKGVTAESYLIDIGFLWGPPPAQIGSPLHLQLTGKCRVCLSCGVIACGHPVCCTTCDRQVRKCLTTKTGG